MYEMLAGRSPFDIAGASENPDQNTEDYLFQVILEKTIRIPRSLSVKAANVLKGFLNKNPADRLGCHSPDSFTEITSHQFFKNIEWDAVSQNNPLDNCWFWKENVLQLKEKRLTPPYVPKTENVLDNFDPQFTIQSVSFTADDK